MHDGAKMYIRTLPELVVFLIYDRDDNPVAQFEVSPDKAREVADEIKRRARQVEETGGGIPLSHPVLRGERTDG